MCSSSLSDILLDLIRQGHIKNCLHKEVREMFLPKVLLVGVPLWCVRAYHEDWISPGLPDVRASHWNTSACLLMSSAFLFNDVGLSFPERSLPYHFSYYFAQFACFQNAQRQLKRFSRFSYNLDAYFSFSFDCLFSCLENLSEMSILLHVCPLRLVRTIRLGGECKSPSIFSRPL